MQRLDSSDRFSGIKATLGGSERLYRRVLKDVTFSAEEGDRIGVIGFNGAGKTTLLRVLNGAFAPTTGRVERHGSTQSLLNATLGFAEYASVTENVILRGTAMGLRRRQLDVAMPEILDFAGLSDRATHRLHTLSSGQRMRLGFAISTAIQPDILLMDEWIATGDAAFIARAQKRLRTRLSDSRIVVLASHSPELLRELCTKAIVLDEGRMLFFGGIEQGLTMYADMVARAGADAQTELSGANPILFGESLGNIEGIRVGARRIEIEGWARQLDGAPAMQFSVGLDGVKHTITEFERVDRVDVRNYLAKRRGDYGFRFAIDGQSFEGDAADVAMRLQVAVFGDGKVQGRPLQLVRGGRVETLTGDALA
jgi:ABC-type polysaccharide/polyol phosphate transport system ATPase subunit